MLIPFDDPIWDFLEKYSKHIKSKYDDNWYYHLNDLSGINDDDLETLRSFDFEIQLTSCHHAFDNYELLYQPKDLKKLDKETVAYYKEWDGMIFSKIGQHIFPNYEVLYQK